MTPTKNTTTTKARATRRASCRCCGVALDESNTYRTVGMPICRSCFNRRPRNPIERLVQRSRGRARRLGLPHTVKATDLKLPTHCSVTGLPLLHGRGICSDNSPALVRFVPERGWVPDNVAIVSHRGSVLHMIETRKQRKATARALKVA